MRNLSVSSQADTPQQQGSWPSSQQGTQLASLGAAPAALPAQMAPGDMAMYSGWGVTVSNLQMEEDVLQTADLVHVRRFPQSYERR